MLFETEQLSVLRYRARQKETFILSLKFQQLLTAIDFGKLLNLLSQVITQ